MNCVDAIGLSVFSSRIDAACNEMGAVLRHAAFSTNIKDRLDLSCAPLGRDDGSNGRREGRMKTLSLGILLLMLGCHLAGCAALIAGGAPAGGHNTSASRTGAGETSHDAAITATINSKYVNDHLVEALAVRVTTYQGVVTLQGSVKSQAAAARAVELARATPHVRRVVSRLTVVP